MNIASALTNGSFPPKTASEPFTWLIYSVSFSSVISWEVLMAYLIHLRSSTSSVHPPTSCHKGLMFSRCRLEKLLLLCVTAQNYDDSHWELLACPPLTALVHTWPPRLAYLWISDSISKNGRCLMAEILWEWKDSDKWAIRRNAQLGKVLPVGTCLCMVITSSFLGLLYSSKKSLKLESMGNSSLYP